MKLINGWYKITTFLKLKEYDLLFGKNFRHGRMSFRKRFTVLVEKGGELIIGNGCFFNNDCSITCMGRVSVGENSIFGEGVKIYDHNYHINNAGRLIKNSGHTLGEVIIGNNCWIGSNVVILKGANIGNNCVIGAGCVISGTVNDETLVTLDPGRLKAVHMERKSE